MPSSQNVAGFTMLKCTVRWVDFNPRIQRSIDQRWLKPSQPFSMDQLNTSASAAQSAPSTASWDSWQETAVGYLHGFAMGLWTLVTYFFTPRVIFSHSICVALLWHLYRQGTGIKVLLPVAILEEVASYFLWWAIPNSWATILTLWASIYVYETLLGPKIFVKRNAVIVCGKSQHSTGIL